MSILIKKDKLSLKILKMIIFSFLNVQLMWHLCVLAYYSMYQLPFSSHFFSFLQFNYASLPQHLWTILSWKYTFFIGGIFVFIQIALFFLYKYNNYLNKVKTKYSLISNFVLIFFFSILFLYYLFEYNSLISQKTPNRLNQMGLAEINFHLYNYANKSENEYSSINRAVQDFFGFPFKGQKAENIIGMLKKKNTFSSDSFKSENGSGNTHNVIVIHINYINNNMKSNLYAHSQVSWWNIASLLSGLPILKEKKMNKKLSLSLPFSSEGLKTKVSIYSPNRYKYLKEKINHLSFNEISQLESFDELEFENGFHYIYLDLIGLESVFNNLDDELPQGISWNNELEDVLNKKYKKIKNNILNVLKQKDSLLTKWFFISHKEIVPFNYLSINSKSRYKGFIKSNTFKQLNKPIQLMDVKSLIYNSLDKKVEYISLSGHQEVVDNKELVLAPISLKLNSKSRTYSELVDYIFENLN